MLVLMLFLGLNASLTVHSWLPAGSPVGALIPAPEAAVLMVLPTLAILVRRTVRRAVRRAVLLFTTILTSILLLYSFGETVVQAIYQREFNPWIDVAFISVGLELLAPATAEHETAFELLAVGLFIIVAGTLGIFYVRGISRVAARVPQLALAAASVVFLGAGVASIAGLSPSLIPRIAGHIRPPSTGSDLQLQDYAHREPQHASDARAMQYESRDVYVIFVESYGLTVFTRPVFRSTIVPTILDIERDLRQRGYTIMSTFLDSPVSGGFSWIAEATFLTGTRIENQSMFDALLVSDAPSIPRMFDEAGYHTILSMPGSVHGEWPEGISFYSFDESIFGREFGYRGPMHSYVGTTDQFALYKTWQRIRSVRAERNNLPVFAQIVLVDSHAPFNRVPPLIDDWDTLGDGSIYYELRTMEFDNGWLTGAEYDEGFAAALTSSLNVVGRFLTDLVDSDALIVLAGDHQPKRPVREENAAKSVVTHVISRDRSLVEQWAHFGYVDGMVPTQPLPHDGMESFFDQLRLVLTNKLPAEGQRLAR